MGTDCHRRKRSPDCATGYVLERGGSIISMDGFDLEPHPVRGPGHAVSTSSLYLCFNGDLRCDGRRVGIQVHLQPPASDRGRSYSEDKAGYAAKSILSIRLR